MTKANTALNPRVVVEVLRPSTEDYDRGEKLGHYKKNQTVEEVVLVAHDLHEIEIVRREADGSRSRLSGPLMGRSSARPRQSRSLRPLVS